MSLMGADMKANGGVVRAILTWEVFVLFGCTSAPAPTIWPAGKRVADFLPTPAPTVGELDDLLPQLPDADDGAKEVMPNAGEGVSRLHLRAAPGGAASVTTRICSMVPAPWPAPHTNLWPRWSCLCDPQKPTDVRMECS